MRQLVGAERTAYLAALNATSNTPLARWRRQASGALDPTAISLLWQRHREATTNEVDVAMVMNGELLRALGGGAKVDESSVAAELLVNSTSAHDIVVIRLRGSLFNVFNSSDDAYFFEMYCRSNSGEYE